MIYKQYLKQYILGLLLFVGVVMGFNYVVDPLQFYRQPTIYEAQYITNARFQLPGVLKHFDYNTVIVGTSMSQNFSEAHLDEALGVKSLNAALSGASTREQMLVASLAINTGKVNKLFWEINFDSFFGEVGRVRDEYGDFPFHMYDEYLLNDVKYLFSYYPIQVALGILKDNWKGSMENRDFSTIHKFGDDQPPLTAEDVLPIFEKEKDSPSQLAEGHRYENMLAHFEQNILPILKANPEIDFTLYYPPFSVVYWFEVKERNEEIFRARMKLKEEIYRQVASLPNVQVYDFQADEQITFALNNYMDTSHYFKDINDLLVDRMGTEKALASSKEALALVRKLENQVFTLETSQLLYDKH